LTTQSLPAAHLPSASPFPEADRALSLRVVAMEARTVARADGTIGTDHLDLAVQGPEALAKLGDDQADAGMEVAAVANEEVLLVAVRVVVLGVDATDVPRRHRKSWTPRWTPTSTATAIVLPLHLRPMAAPTVDTLGLSRMMST
jgi:hypothetical protein